MLARKRGVLRGGQMTPKLLEIFSLDFLGHLYMSEKTRAEFSKKSHFWNTLVDAKTSEKRHYPPREGVLTDRHTRQRKHQCATQPL